VPPACDHPCGATRGRHPAGSWLPHPHLRFSAKKTTAEIEPDRIFSDSFSSPSVVLYHLLHFPFDGFQRSAVHLPVRAMASTWGRARPCLGSSAAGLYPATAFACASRVAVARVFSPDGSARRGRRSRTSSVRDGRSGRSGEDVLPGICWWSSHPQRGGGGPWARRRLAVAARSPTAELVQTTESLGVVLTAYLVSTCKLMAIGELEVSRLCV
jgi:hypothetical protein